MKNPLVQQGVAAELPTNSLLTPPCDHAQVRAEAMCLIEMGLSVAPIIPIELPILNDKGKPIFTGKNPSYWLANGAPRPFPMANRHQCRRCSMPSASPNI